MDFERPIALSSSARAGLRRWLEVQGDRSLSHAVGGAVVSVDLLYTRHTPEQQAMADIADGCFELRFRS